MSQTRSSYEPTRLTAGQAATTAPTGPFDQPWAMFGREGGRDAQPEQPAGQGGRRYPVPCRVQDDHAGGVHEAVDRGRRLQPGGDPAPAAGPDDRAIRLSTAAAVLAVAGIAAYVSYWHAYAVVRAHGGSGITARLEPATIDGLVYASSMVILYAARHRVPAPSLARWLLGLGIAATLTAEHGPGLVKRSRRSSGRGLASGQPRGLL